MGCTAEIKPNKHDNLTRTVLIRALNQIDPTTIDVEKKLFPFVLRCERDDQ